MSFLKKNPVNFHSVKTLCSYSSINPEEPTKILSNYFKSGNVAGAQNLFDEMPEKGLVSWSIMVHGYARYGHYKKSMEFFSEMRNSGLVPNTFTIVGVLVSSASSASLLFTKSVHALVVKYGHKQNLIVGTALLGSYAKCGSAFDAYRVFDGMNNPGLVSCNAVIAGFVYNELLEDAMLIFNRFRKSSMVPGPVTMLSIIKACAGLGCRQLSHSVHGLIEKLGLRFNLSVENSVLDMYFRLLDLTSAEKMFFSMGSIDTISYSIMMSLLVRLERATDALGIFHEMRDRNIDPDSLIIINVISSFAILQDLVGGRQIHGNAIVRGNAIEVPVMNSLVSMYSKCGELDSSRAVFDLLEEKTSVSWAAMISGYEQHGYPNEALDLFIYERREKNFELDSVLLLGILTTASEIALPELTRQLHCLALRTGLYIHRPVQNSLISAYSKSGDMELALAVFNDMGSSRIKDTVSWNAVLNGYSVNGQAEKAMTFYYDMKKAGIDPDGPTYAIVLSACSRGGFVYEGLTIFKEMVEEGKLELGEEHYGCVVDLLSRAGDLWDAVGLARRLLGRAGLSVWRALLSGCTLHQNVELGEFAVRTLTEMDEGEMDIAVMVSNFYASVGRFEDAEVFRSSLGRKGMAKVRAVSSINSIRCDRGGGNIRYQR